MSHPVGTRVSVAIRRRPCRFETVELEAGP